MPVIIGLAIASLAWALFVIRVFGRDILFPNIGDFRMTLPSMRARMIDDWRSGFKYWSVRLNFTGATITALLLAIPDTLAGLWSCLPAEFVSFVPETTLRFIPLILFVAAIGARLIKQKGADDA